MRAREIAKRSGKENKQHLEKCKGEPHRGIVMDSAGDSATAMYKEWLVEEAKPKYGGLACLLIQRKAGAGHS